MMFRTPSRFLFGTFRGRLILGVAAVHAVMMTLFIGDSTLRQRALLLDRQTEEATALSQTLADSTAASIAADDVSGLQELAEAQHRYPELLFAIFADEQGRVLADTDRSKRGLYLHDLPRDARQTVLSKTPALVDVAVPVMIGARHVGWARVGIGQKGAGEKLAEITRSGILYTLAAILIGSAIAWFMGRRLTRRLYAVQETINAVRSGDRLARSSLAGSDEAAVMAREFNCMLDALAEREAELQGYKNHLEDLVQQRTFELEAAKDAAETANRAKSAFLANMSHELRTPLNAVLGFSSLLCQAPDTSEEQRRILDIINHSGEHLLNLINDVLDVAKIEAGWMTVENEPFDLGDLVHTVTEMMSVRAEEKGLMLRFDQSLQFPRFIQADPAKLRQVLINLIGNAVKFTQEGRVTVRLGEVKRLEDSVSVPTGGDGRNGAASAPATAPQRLPLRIEVEDTGIGIAAEDQTRIFEPFVQLGKLASQKGTGLGLTITRQYVELMGGTIEVQSRLGRGTRFRVEVPVERSEQSEVMATPFDCRRVIGLLPGQPEYRILIVEDERHNRLLLQRLLEPVGFQVRVAENGVVGVAVFREWRPHFIWMDWRMPEMDGLEATRSIRTLDGGGEVKVVALTASVFREQRNDVLTAGLDDFICKPFRLAEIFDCLTRHLGVRYVYAEAAAEEPVAPLRPEVVAALPGTLRHELADALVCLDVGRIASLIGHVGQQDAALGRVLAHYADRLAFASILKALEAGVPPSPEQ